MKIYSWVEAILDKENVTLEELLDEEDIIQECKALNSHLSNFLRDRLQVEQLLRYIIEEPQKDADSKRTFKFPFMACEIFTCEIDVIFKTLVEDEELMDLLFSFLEPTRPHSALLAGYFSKVVVDKSGYDTYRGGFWNYFSMDFSKEPAFAWMKTLSDEVKSNIQNSKILFCNGYGFDKLPAGLISSALEYAVEVGTSIFFDPGPRGKSLAVGTPEEQEALAKLLRLSDVLLLTSEEESSTGHGHGVQPACSNGASADSPRSCKTKPNPCYGRQLSNISFSSLTGESTAADYQDCGASSMLLMDSHGVVIHPSWCLAIRS